MCASRHSPNWPQLKARLPIFPSAESTPPVLPTPKRLRAGGLRSGLWFRMDTQPPPLRPELVGRGIRDQRLLAAMEQVDRRAFVDASVAQRAYRDESLPIGEGQRLGTPFLTAQMVALARIQPGHRVLEIGTGSGYSAAVIATMGAHVCSIESNATLVSRARQRLVEWPTIQVHSGDGRTQWPEGGLFNSILVGGATQHLSDTWLDQLELGGRLIAAVGDDTAQELVVLERTRRGFTRRGTGPVYLTALTP